MVRREIILFFIVIISFTYFFQYGDDNIYAHLAPIYSVVDHGTFKIDNFSSFTIDKAFYAGHYYSDKPPGITFLGIPIYFVFKFMMSIFGQSYLYKDVRYVITVFLISFPTSLLGLIIYRFLGYFLTSERKRFFLVLVYALGTLAFPYATLCYGHQLSAVLLFIAFYLLFSLKNNLLTKKYYFLISGFLLGYSLIIDYPSGIVAFLLVLYSLRFINKETGGLTFLGGMIPLIILFIYNWLCFENIFALGYHFIENPCAPGMKEGFMGITLPSLKKLYAITFSPYRGIFITSPVLILTIPGFYYFFQEVNRVGKSFRSPDFSAGINLKDEFYVCLLSTVGFLVFNASYTFWWGGLGVGPRHLVNVLPFVILPIAFYVEKNKKVLIFLGVLSIIFMSIVTVTLPQVSEEINNPFFKFLLPNFIRGNILPNWGNFLGLSGLISLIPWVVFVVFGISIGLVKNKSVGHS